MSGEIQTNEVKTVTSNAEKETQRALTAKARAEAAEAESRTELARLDIELKQAELEAKRHELERLKRENNEARSKQQDHEANQIKQQTSEQKTAVLDLVKMSNCNHKQGGENMEGLYNGDDNNFAINEEVTLLGESTFRCTRCKADWTKKNSSQKKRFGYSFEEVKKLPHKGFKRAVPVTYTIPGVNCPLPEGWVLNAKTKQPQMLDGYELVVDEETEELITRKLETV